MGVPWFARFLRPLLLPSQFYSGETMNEIEICNLSLMMLGIPSITSFDDENVNAKMCKKFFPVVRDRVLRDHSWSFATAYYDLQPSTEESPEPEYPYVCTQPYDMIRILELEGGKPYLHVGDAILVCEVPVRLKYIKRVTAAEEFDPLFAEALQYALAAEIVLTNTRDAQMVNFYRSEYERRLVVARSIDSQENRHAIQPGPQRSHWIDAHMCKGVRLSYLKPGLNWVKGTEGIQGEQIVEPSEQN